MPSRSERSPAIDANMNYGFARARDLAFDAVRAMWARRVSEGMTQQELAQAMGRDPAWVSRNLGAPGNWTLRTFGEFVEAMHGEPEIYVKAIEDADPQRSNYDAYVANRGSAIIVLGKSEQVARPASSTYSAKIVPLETTP